MKPTTITILFSTPLNCENIRTQIFIHNLYTVNIQTHINKQTKKNNIKLLTSIPNKNNNK